VVNCGEMLEVHKINTKVNAVKCRGVSVTKITASRSVDWIIFIILNDNAIAILHNLQFTVTHALGFSFFTSRIMVTELKESRCD
jgi:hypothetical protein